MTKLVRKGRKLVRCGGKFVRDTNGASCACGGGPSECFWRFDGCPSTGECAVTAPAVYIPCGATCGDGSPVTDRVITINTTDYAGWCWRRVDDCRYTPGPDIPPGWCKLPDDAVVVDTGIECVSGCNDPACSRRGTYIVPTICEGTCGPEDPKILICPADGVSVSKCQYIHVNIGNGYCGCIVIGPHSREFTGDPTGYTILDYDGTGWFDALDPQTACCECCAHSSCSNQCEYRRILPPSNSKQPPYCFDKFYPQGVVCCCGSRWMTIAVAHARHNLVNQNNFGDFFRSELLEHGWSLASFEWDTGNNYTCRGASGRVTTFEQERRNGSVTFENYQVWTVDNCADAAFFNGPGADGCLIRGADMMLCNFPMAYDPNGRRSVWGNAVNMMLSYHNSSGFAQGVPGTCSGTAAAIYGNCGDVGCSGSYAVSGACQIGRLRGDYGEDYTASQTTTHLATHIVATVYRVVLDQQSGCGGGCGGKQPRGIDDTGGLAGGMAGAGDLL